MTMDTARFQILLNDFKLEQLFNELGWDHASLKPQELPVGGETFTLNAIAQKRGVAVLRCTPDATGNIPPRPTLLKIEKEAAKLAHEHLPRAFLGGCSIRRQARWLFPSLAGAV